MKKNFVKVQYSKIVSWERLSSTAHLHLTSSCYVIDSKLMATVNPQIKDELLICKHLQEVVSIFKKQGISIKNIDIPMIYGIKTNDIGLRIFINEYLKAGGPLNLNCFVNYNELYSQEEKELQ